MNNIIGIVAEKLGHSLSPYIHNYWSEEYNQNLKYKKFEISEKNLMKFFQAFKENIKFKGFNVTIPYKTNFITLCDKITPKAKKIGSVNLVYKKNNLIIGDNTDAIGFEKCFKQLKNIPSNKVLLIGAGGAARSILYCLNQKNIENIDVFATSFRRKNDICNDFIIKSFMTKISLLKSNYDLIINSSSGGMVGKSPLNRNLIKLVDGTKGVVDIVYNPEMTPLLNRAKKNNIPYVGGLTMLIEQAKPSYEKWSNLKIKIDDKIYQLARNKLK
jgi:shikimate dehydrogenase